MMKKKIPEILLTKQKLKKKRKPTKRYRKDGWTPQEKQRLSKLYRSKNAKEVGEILGRTEASVRTMSRELGLRKKYPIWTQEADAELIRSYHDTPNKILAERLNRTVLSIQHRAVKFGLKKEVAHWTPEDDEKIKKRYPKMNTVKLAETLGRTLVAVRARAAELNVKKIITPFWRLEDDQFMIRNYQKMTILEIAEALGVSVSTINNHAKKLGLRKVFRWTCKEVALLRQLYPELSAREAAIFLNKSRKSVILKALQLKKAENSPKKNIKKKWTKKEDWILEQLYPVLKTKDIAKHLDRSKSTIHYHIKKLGLYRLKEPSESELLSEFKYKWLLRHFTGIELIPKETYGTKILATSHS